MQPELRAREHRVRVGADREERRVAQIEQAREADDHVEPEREDHEDACVGQDIHGRVARAERRPQQQPGSDHEQGDLLRARHTFSVTASPSRPAGLKTSTTIRIAKTATFAH